MSGEEEKGKLANYLLKSGQLCNLTLQSFSGSNSTVEILCVYFHKWLSVQSFVLPVREINHAFDSVWPLTVWRMKLNPILNLYKNGFLKNLYEVNGTNVLGYFVLSDLFLSLYWNYGHFSKSFMWFLFFVCLFHSRLKTFYTTSLSTMTKKWVPVEIFYIFTHENL